MNKTILQDLQETKIRLFQRVIIAFLLLMAISLPAILLPLYFKLKEEKNTHLLFLLETKKMSLNQYLDTLTTIILQINSRSQIKTELIDYYHGKINRDDLVKNSCPKLNDAMSQARHMHGLIRLDNSFKPICQRGINLDPRFFNLLKKNPENIQYFPPLQINHKNYLVISSPIKNHAEILGFDIGIFETEKIYSILYDNNLKNKADLAISLQQGKKNELIFNEQSELKMKDNVPVPVHENEEHIHRSTNLENGWKLHLLYHSEELYKIINYTILITFLIAFGIIITGIVILILIIRPVIDLLDRKNKNLANLLFIDPLTELPNRTMLKVDLSSKKFNQVLIVDIIKFNELNDFYGNTAGDFIIKELSKIIQSSIADKNCRLYSLGGDEFAILFHRESTNMDINHFADQLSNQIEKYPFQYQSFQILIQVKTGSSDRQPLLETADMALKKAKKETKSKHLVYDESLLLYESIQKNYETIYLVKSALETAQLIPYFQPITEIKTGKIVKYECLARIMTNDNKVIPPVHFLEIAKKTTFYPAITKQMISSCLPIFTKKNIEFSINLSTLDLMNEETIDFLTSELEKYPDIIAEGKLVIEILETEGINNYESIIGILHLLKNNYNIKISIDDFGAGYSNFSRILQLQVNYLKIDSSLIMNIHINPHAEAIVKSIVDFSRIIKVKTIAEYVHSQEVNQRVHELGVDFAQGFYYSPPLPHLKD